MLFVLKLVPSQKFFVIGIQGVKKRMDPLSIFACFITVSFKFLEIYSYEQIKPNKTKLFGVYGGAQ